LAAQDFDVTLISSVTRTAKKPSSWKTLNNKEWLSSYATSTVTDYSDLHLIIDQASFGIRLSQNWSYSLETPPTTIDCDWPTVLLNGSGFKISMSHSSDSNILMPASVQPYRFVLNLNMTHRSGNVSNVPDLPWPEPYSFIAAGNMSLRDRLDICPDGEWLGPRTAFHVHEAHARINPYANRVQIAVPFLSIVIFANIIKVIAIYCTIRMRSSGHIITAGDAVASFFEHPEPATRGKCTWTKPQLCSSKGEAIAKPWQVINEPMIVVLGGTRAWSGSIMYVF
jgi:hypothetical protein